MNDSEPTEPSADRATSSRSHVRVGDVLGGRYEVTRIIGKGAMGVVVEAKHGVHGQRVAVKVLHGKHKENAEAVARFTQEGRASATVRGEHTVRLFDMGEHDGAPFLVMELLSGADLATVLDDGPVPLETAASYILQACEGIAEVHAHGIVHRDLKPSNLFLTKRPDGSPLIKILDFGIAKGVASDDKEMMVLTQTFVAVGTPLYMSPEQIRASSAVDARADVWSLGTIFFELVAGRPAFGGSTVTNITAQVLEKDPPPLSSVAKGVPPEIDAVVASALKKHADERYIDVAALASALEPFAGADGRGSAARSARILRGALRSDAMTTSPPVTREDAIGGGTIRFDPTRRARVQRVVVGLIAALTVVLIGLAGVAYRDRTESEEVVILAKRGLSATIGRAASTLTTPSASADVSSAAPAVSSAAAPAPPSTASSNDLSMSAIAVKTVAPPSTEVRPTPTVRPPPPAGTVKASPAVAPDPKPFNPFSER